MKIMYTILFGFVFLIHLIFLGIIKLIELIGKGFCWINDYITDVGNYLSDKSNVDDVIAKISSKLKRR